MNKSTEIKLLQTVVAVGCLVPICGGALGVVQGTGLLNQADVLVSDVSLDSHVRYLSGLLLAIGFAFLSAIPNIEKQGAKVSFLTAIVVVGGLARLYGAMTAGWPATTMIFALVMELGVVPALWLWHRRITNLP